MLSDLDPDVSNFIHQRTVEIKALVKRSVQNVLEVGEKLLQVKERLGHGRFGEWLASEFEWSQDTANNFMRVAQHFSGNPKISEFAPSALYILTAPSTPDTARREAVELVEQGESISYAKAKSIVERHKEENQLPNVTSFANNDDQAKFDSTEDTAKDKEDLTKLEAIANAPVHETSEESLPTKDEPGLESSQSVESPKPVTDKKPKSELVPFQCSMSQQQRERLFAAINKAKNQYELKTTPEALDVIAQEYLNAQ